MPRDINGNFSLDPSNPVIPGTVIETGWANPTLQDIAAALTDSLSRSGSGGMLAPFRFSDGTLAAPGIAFTNEPSSGLYRAALNDIRFAIGSSDVLRFIPSGVVIPAGKTLTGGLTITGGSINGTPIGNTTPSTGAFTTVAASTSMLIGGVITASDASIDVLRNSTSNVESSSGIYIRSGAGATNVGLEMGADKVGGIAFIQSTEPATSFATKVLSLNPNGGTVKIGVAPSMSLTASSIDTGAAPLFLNANSGGQTRVGTPAGSNSQTSAYFSVRGNGNALEFGHVNAAGYACVLGAHPSDGMPVLGFNCDLDPANMNLYRTRGVFGSVIEGDLGGGVRIGRVPNANAAGQTPVSIMQIQSIGLANGIAQPWSFYTGAFGASAFEQLRLLYVGGANVVTISANAGNPQIGTTGGAVAFSAPILPLAGIAPAFESAEQGIPVGNTVLSVAHGLGRTPKLTLTVLRCKIADLGYAIGDEVAIPSAGVNPMVSTWASSTTCKYVCSSSTPQITDAVGATGVQPITTARWRVVFYAW